MGSGLEIEVHARQNNVNILGGQGSDFRILSNHYVYLLYKQHWNAQDGKQQCVKEVLAV